MIIRNIRKAFNALLTGALGAFGFSSCLLAMYGVPEVFVDVTGQVTDSTGRPLKDIVVSGNTRQGLGAVNTDENGRFHMTVEAFNAQYLFLRDPSTADGCYMPDTVKFEYENEKSTGSWTSKAEAHDLHIIMREGTLDEYRATYDIIGSWTEIRIADNGGKIVWLPSIWSFFADGTFSRGPLPSPDGGGNLQADQTEGNYSYEYRVLRTNLDADSLVFGSNSYRYRAWTKGNEVVMWVPSWVSFQSPSLSGYYQSCYFSGDELIVEDFHPTNGGYLIRQHYRDGKIIKSELYDVNAHFEPYTDNREGGIFTALANGGKSISIQIVSVSRYGFAAGDKAPYHLYVRTE